LKAIRLSIIALSSGNDRYLRISTFHWINLWRGFSILPMVVSITLDMGRARMAFGGGCLCLAVRFEIETDAWTT
jgi:hypothetical protein